MTTRKNGSGGGGTLLFRQGYDLKNRLVEADADGDADADLRLAYDHQEGRVARHTLDGQGGSNGWRAHSISTAGRTRPVTSPKPMR